MIKLISFDLQGTISDASYSNYFWLEYLAEHKEFFKKIGPYDYRYYDDSYWSKNTLDIMKNLQPTLNNEFIEFITTIKLPKIILSTTTKAFIKLELGEHQNIFDACYSCLDDFGIAGKTKNVFEKVANVWGVKTSQILHIGDNFEMDIINAKAAGCKTIHFVGDTTKTIGEIKWNMK